MSVGAAHRDRTERWGKERLLFGTPVSLAKMIFRNRLTLPRGIAASIGPAEYLDVEAGDGRIILASSVALTRLCQADAGTDAPKKMSDLLRKMLKRLHPRSRRCRCACAGTRRTRRAGASARLA